MVARLWCLDCGSYFIDKADAVVDLSQVGELVWTTCSRCERDAWCEVIAARRWRVLSAKPELRVVHEH